MVTSDRPSGRRPTPSEVNALASAAHQRGARPPRFSYSTDEWARIERAVQRVRPGSLGDHEKRRIHSAAFLFHHEDRTAFLKTRNKALLDQWQNVATLGNELNRAIAAATAMYADPPALIKRASRTVEQLRLHALEWLEATATNHAEKNRHSFERKIFEIWTDAFGGKLSAPRNSAPLVEFFLAVANPALKKPLRPSTIKKKADEEKKRRKAHKSDG
jgi:hypothetical protein